MDLYELTIKFESQPMVSNMAEFSLLKRVLHDQCEVSGDKQQSVSFKLSDEVQIPSERELDELWDDELEPQGGASIKLKDPKDVSSDSLQYLTDPDASYSEHKGKGYQAQIVETIVNSDDPEEKKSKLKRQAR
jgi:hypothetical protein